MDLSIEKIDQNHDRYRLRMAGTAERDRYLRCFPNPMPSTHRLVYRWEDSKAGMFLTIEAQPIAEADAAEKATPVDLHKDPREKLRVELQMIKDRNDLLTKAGESGVEVKPKMSNAQIIAAIVDRLIPAKLAEPAAV